MRLTKQGFTLIELLVALVLGTMMASALYTSLTNTQRSSHALMQRADVQQNVRAATHYLTTVLRELDAYDGDVLAVTPNSVRFRGMRWTGLLCANPTLVTSTRVLLPIRRDDFFGVRAPSASLDSVLIFRDGDPATRQDDRWLVGAPVAAGTGNCADGSPAHDLTVEVTASSGGTDSVMVGVTSGTPLRGFQVEELALASVSARWWLTQRSASRSGLWALPQRLVGPLDPNGFALSYFDSSAVATTVADEMTAVRITVNGQSLKTGKRSDGAIGYMQDSLVTRVALRNNTRT